MGKIFNSLERFIRDGYIFFTTPGHKGGEEYRYIDNLFKLDLTEVRGLDNLHVPKECIKDSLEDLSSFYESYKSYYLLNGSTSGVQIMIFSSFKENDKVIIERGCHKSIINAIILRKLRVFYVDRDKYTTDLLMPEGYSFINYNKKDMLLSDIKEIIEENPDIKGVILTNPNYYGIYINQVFIYDYLKGRGILFLIDGAHGAHIRAFNSEIPCVNKFCDMSVMSAHKTLNALTQGAYLHVNNKSLVEDVDEYFSIFMTTSPSYLIMMSLERSIEDLMNQFYESTTLLYKCRCINSLGLSYIEVLNNEGIKKRSNHNFLFDDTRITIRLNENFGDGSRLYDYLYNNKIICEMSYFGGVVLIPTIYTPKFHFDILYYRLKGFEQQEGQSYNGMLDIIPIMYKIKSYKVYEPYEVLYRKYRLVEIDKSEGNILFNDILLYPPGSPMIIRGERICYEHICIILEYIRLNYEVNGIVDNKYLKVVEE